ncbi:MAG: HD domain-containing protein [Bacilli bacterium]|nr:HD domain-containing protein [Bacilli bacterium]
MASKFRFSIRVKLAIMSTATIALAVSALGVTLTVSSASSAHETAANNLSSVSVNATLALENTVNSLDTSMKLLANQIGYNSVFANSITTASTDSTSAKNLKAAMSGSGLTGDGSTIIGAMDYLIITDDIISSATMYSPYIDAKSPIANRLFHTSASVIECTTERYNELTKHPGNSYWFFVDNSLYVWKALINYGVDDVYDMGVVGYIEYGFNRNYFLDCVVSTAYQDEGMLLFDENNQTVLSISSGLDSVDERVANDAPSLKSGLNLETNYTAYSSSVSSRGWKYVAFINHTSLDKSINANVIFSVLIIAISIIFSALVAFLLSAREVNRIKRLSAAAKEVAEGNYDMKVPNMANDEITEVTDSFNTMASKVQETLQQLILQQDSISENFATILSNKSGESGNHVKRVGEYSAILAEELGFEENHIHDIRIASMLHDVGKIMVDESILHKPGRFTDEEYKIMQEHVDYGGKLLKGVPGNIMQLGALIAQYHHERWDGKGYTHHLKENEIPVEAQITSVADVFDALVSKRCYKNAWTIEQAYEEIVRCSGTQFSPRIVEAFQKRFEDFKKIASVYKDEE